MPFRIEKKKNGEREYKGQLFTPVNMIPNIGLGVKQFSPNCTGTVEGREH